MKGRWVHELEVRPQFYDVDPMNVVWHGHYLKFFEQCRQELLGGLGYGYKEMLESGYIWPIVDVHLRYVKYGRLLQPMTVRAEIVEYENRLKLEYLVTSEGQRLTKGYTVQVAVDAKTQELQLVTPRILWERLGVAP